MSLDRNYFSKLEAFPGDLSLEVAYAYSCYFQFYSELSMSVHAHEPHHTKEGANQHGRKLPVMVGYSLLKNPLKTIDFK